MNIENVLGAISAAAGVGSLGLQAFEVWQKKREEGLDAERSAEVGNEGLESAEGSEPAPDNNPGSLDGGSAE
ncbi:hypothetical protein [Streptomyces chattanoogensis]|uniref:hypothetical protein n=1 Tax=Streptomyces chattanoogensis TaxID=66876 RepID=UPI003686F8E9